MYYSTIKLSDGDGEIVSKAPIRFWNASRDEVEPGLCIAISGEELKKFLNVKLPVDPLLEIVLPIPKVRKVIG